MRLHAFQGLRYTGGGGARALPAAPPYAQTDAAARARFQAPSPSHFAPPPRPLPAADAEAPPASRAGGASSDPYRHAAELHRRWLRDGIVARDERPALYPYVIRLAGGGQRLGALALAAHAPPTVIRAHEQTVD